MPSTMITTGTAPICEDSDTQRDHAFSSQHPQLPGQAPGHSAALLTELRRHYAPQDVIEEMWLRDIAWQMAKIDYFRTATAGLHDYALRAIQPGLASTAMANDSTAIGELMAKDWRLKNGTPGVLTPAFQRLLGFVTNARLQNLGQLATLEQMMVRERDRIIAQFERRRREQLHDTVRMVEAKAVNAAPAGR